jgi:hypothetical protein
MTKNKSVIHIGDKTYEIHPIPNSDNLKLIPVDIRVQAFNRLLDRVKKWESIKLTPVLKIGSGNVQYILVNPDAPNGCYTILYMYDKADGKGMHPYLNGAGGDQWVNLTREQLLEVFRLFLVNYYDCEIV